MGELILGAGYKPTVTASLATVGGTGAIRQALELARMAAPGLRVWVSATRPGRTMSRS
jgi:aspartate/tyrosine/aromatic aminotransferase